MLANQNEKRAIDDHLAKAGLQQNQKGKETTNCIKQESFI